MQAVEEMIAKQCIADLLDAGFSVSVHDGEEETTTSKDGTVLFAAMATTDEDYLIARKEGYQGWVRFIYGNDGYDVINDYTLKLEPYLARTMALCEKLSR